MNFMKFEVAASAACAVVILLGALTPEGREHITDVYRFAQDVATGTD